ncbi:MIP/aquaporin family protein [Lichenicoccus sp.]|uniref:MIP/aquaporin family protein n=1 Tax=Lichenicoccus sp. TaxID=2781899 RepID=UPI003D0B0F9A
MADWREEVNRRAGPTTRATPTWINLARASLAELIGTFLLVLVGTAVVIAATQGKGTAGPAYNSLAVALSFGLILIAIVGALGQISGAHVNPAVTLGLAYVGRFPWRTVPVYFVAQIAGAVIASLVVWAAFGQGAYTQAHLGLPAPVHGASNLQVLLVEALIAFILVLTVVATATDPRVPAGTASVAIGFALAAGVLLGGPVSGGAGNPARALGPMIVTGRYPVWFFYTAGPLLGGVVAALLYRLIGSGSAPTVAVADQTADHPDVRPHEAFIPPLQPNRQDLRRG